MEYWFKRRRYGYGWVPVTSEGWIALGGYIFVLVIGSASIDEMFTSEATVSIVFILFTVVLTAMFLALVASKSPKPKWRWGRKPGDNPKEDY